MMMRSWFDRILLALLVLVTLVLTLTALSAVGPNPLGGKWLLAHMAASGLLVFGLPLCSIVWLRYFFSHQIAFGNRVVLLWLIASGLVTIATILVCMLPIASTEVMHRLIHWHGYAGYAMSIAVAALVLSWFLGRPKTASESQPD